MKKRKFIAGILIGLVCPIVGIVVFYLWKAPSAPFLSFLQAMIENRTLLTAAVSFSLLINAIVFTWSVNTGRDDIAKGIFVVTLVITIPAIVYKVFF